MRKLLTIAIALLVTFVAEAHSLRGERHSLGEVKNHFQEQLECCHRAPQRPVCRVRATIAQPNTRLWSGVSQSPIIPFNSSRVDLGATSAVWSPVSICSVSCVCDAKR